MAKNIVICSDGTGNTTIKGRGTNVFKLFEAVDVHGHRSGGLTRQVAFYDDGVGTEPWKPLRLLSGALGLGLGRNVRQLYAELVRRKEVTPAELLDAAVSRIEAGNATVNAVVHRMYDEARAALAAGLPEGPFRGVPFLLKDLGSKYAGVRPRSHGLRVGPATSGSVKGTRPNSGVLVLPRISTPEAL